MKIFIHFLFLGLSPVIVVQSRGQSPETVQSLGTGRGPNLGTAPGARTTRTRMDTGTQSQDQSPGQDRGQGPSQQTKNGILEFTLNQYAIYSKPKYFWFEGKYCRKMSNIFLLYHSTSFVKRSTNDSSNYLLVFKRLHSFQSLF